MPVHEKLDYVELPAVDLKATKQFFSAVFGWTFVDYGPDYTAFSNQGLDGGFFKAPSSEFVSSTAKGSALLVFYSNHLAKTQEKIVAAGGTIIKPVFSFPGGRRFHFVAPCGNEYAVWCEN